MGAIRAFRLARPAVPGAQLVLAGSGASDDPEGERYRRLTEEEARGDGDIRLVHDAPDIAINALQSFAAVVLQKSIREGFGLTVSEAMWKRRPVVGGRAGGITLQVRHGENGFLVGSVEEAGERVRELLRDPDLATSFGHRAREDVARSYLVTRELEDYLDLFRSLLGAPSGPRGAPAS
ncbi:MAG TPA: glycosyltransferase [Actinomycetota bacterium]|nr:glycosyltransferase [Actinomycetota bacterium]